MMNLKALDNSSFAQMAPDPSHAYYNRTPLASGAGQMAPMQPPAANNMQDNLAAYFAAVNRPNNMSPVSGSGFGLPYQPGNPPPFMPSQGGPMLPHGGMPQFGGFQRPMMQPPMQQQGGYDSSGINPGGMYFPQNPGGFAPLRNLGFGGR